MDPRASMMHNLGSQGQHDAKPWIPGDLVGVPSRDSRGPGQQQQSPAGRYSMQFPRWILGDLVGVSSSDPRGPVLDAVPSIDSIGAGTGWSCGPVLDAVPSIDPRGPGWNPSSDQHRPGQLDAIPCGPGLDAQSWIHGLA